MRKIAELIGKDLDWLQPKASQMKFALDCGDDEPAATLNFKSAWLGLTATGESADGRWKFRKVGGVKLEFVVSALAGSTDRSDGTDIAVFGTSSIYEGGTLELVDERRIATSRIRMGKYEFKNEAGEVILRYNPKVFLTWTAEMEIFPAASGMPELPWMALLGWYLTILSSSRGEYIVRRLTNFIG
jgi:hypothetical protein